MSTFRAHFSDEKKTQTIYIEMGKEAIESPVQSIEHNAIIPSYFLMQVLVL